MWLVLVVLFVTLGTGCAPRHFSLLRQEGREWLLPPGVRKASSPAPRAEADCTTATPVTPRASHFARYGCYVQAGFVDLQAGMRLKIVKPVLPAAEPLKTEVARVGLNLTVRSNVTGVETRYVEVTRRRDGVYVQVGFSPGITHYRLFFLARDLDRGRKITLVGARSAAEMEAATRTLDEYCGAPHSPCLTVSEGTVIGAQIPVRVRGKVEYFPLGARLAEAVPAAVDASRLTLARRWHGRSTPVVWTGPSAPSLLSLPLNGGDSILW